MCTDELQHVDSGFGVVDEDIRVGDYASVWKLGGHAGTSAQELMRSRIPESGRWRICAALFTVICA